MSGLAGWGDYSWSKKGTAGGRKTLIVTSEALVTTSVALVTTSEAPVTTRKALVTSEALI